MTIKDEDMPPARDAANSIGLVTMKPPKYDRKELKLKAEDFLKVQLELNATTSATAREGLDLVAVLDVSGSMKNKIESLKKAMQFVIMKLTDKDRLSIVTFSDVGDTLCRLRSMNKDAQTELTTIVNGLKVINGTNIKDGLEKGLAEITSRKFYDGRTANVFLMSDGVQTSGDAGEVEPGNVAVYTFGFGTGTDHKLLSKIANKSAGGTFSSCPDGSNLSSPFAKLVGGLTTIVAQDVQLTLTSNLKEVEKMEVSPGIDYKAIPTFNASGDKVITIFFGTIFSGESRKVIVNFMLKSSPNSKPFNAKIAVAQHSYKAQRGVETQPPKDIIRRRTNKTDTSPSKDSAELHAEEVRQQVAVAVREARKLADTMSEGDKPEEKVVDERKLQDARYILQEALNAVEGIMLDDSEKMVGILRDELQKLIKLMATKGLYKSEGLPYALAVESSHWLQRTAGKGGDDKAVEHECLYDTPRMKTCSKQAQDFEKNPENPVPSADDDDKEELAANPLAAVAAPLVMHLDIAIQALQAIKEILVHTA